MKNDKKISNINSKATIISIVVAVWIICLALVFTKCELDKRATEGENAVNETEEVSLVEKELEGVKTKKTGTVKTEESKTFAFYNSHFANQDYSSVTEYTISQEEQGDYYQTELITYSADGYKYKEVYMNSFEELEIYNDVAVYVGYLYTPEKSYILNPETMSYTEHDVGTSSAQNEIKFENKVFETGKITFRGAEYDYESSKDANGTKTTYCIDKNGDVKHVITEAPNGKVITSYISYSTEIDRSVFEIPDGYMPM